MYIPYNPNPDGRMCGDCTVRAIAKATGASWDEVYAGLALEGFLMHDMPTANRVWGAYLRRKGYKRRAIPDDCPDCYTLAQFAADHHDGTYIAAINGHVVCVIDGDWYDSWNSSDETVIYYWHKGERDE